MLSYIFDGMLILIIFFLIRTIFNVGFKKEKILGENKCLATASIIFAVILIVYLVNSHLSKDNIPTKTFSFKENNMAFILNTKKQINLNINALWNMCPPTKDINRNKHFRKRVLDFRILEIISDQIRTMALKSNNINELENKVNNNTFINENLNSAREYGICIKNLKIKAYNKAIKKDV